MIILEEEKYPEPHSIMSYCIFTWDIPLSIRDRLDQYYILSWDTKYFLSLEYQAQIHRNGITYNTVYHKTTLNEIKKHSKLLLSFRKLPLLPQGYVLISPKKGTKQP